MERHMQHERKAPSPAGSRLTEGSDTARAFLRFWDALFRLLFFFCCSSISALNFKKKKRDMDCVPSGLDRDECDEDKNAADVIVRPFCATRPVNHQNRRHSLPGKYSWIPVRKYNPISLNFDPVFFSLPNGRLPPPSFFFNYDLIWQKQLKKEETFSHLNEVFKYRDAEWTRAGKSWGGRNGETNESRREGIVENHRRRTLVSVAPFFTRLCKMCFSLSLSP